MVALPQTPAAADDEPGAIMLEQETAPTRTSEETVDLAAVVGRTLEELAASEPELEPVEVLLPEGTAVEGDEAALQHILSGLLHNAAQHAADGPISVLLARAGPHWELVVRDAGPGITEHERERIFQPGARHAPDGPGLELYIARSLARAHGGELEACPGPDGGCDMVLRLPRAGHSSPASSQAEDREVVSHSRVGGET